MVNSYEKKIIKKALLSRLVEEKLLSLFSEGKLFGTIHTCIGQEFSGAVISECLKDGDVIFSGHRCHGHYLSRTGDIYGLIAEIMGKKSGICGGFGGSQHLHAKGFFSNGVLGGGAPIAAGVGLALKRSHKGSIAVVFLGDGALGEGTVYETLNLVSKWKIPLLFVLEDNEYAQSTPQGQTLAGSIDKRAEAFDIPVFTGDTWNWKALLPIAAEAMEQVRGTESPAFLHIKTYRLKAHSKGDDTRSKAELAPFEEKDPINQLLLMRDPLVTEFSKEISAKIDEAVAKAEKDACTVLPELFVAAPAVSWKAAVGKPAKIVHLLNSALENALARDSAVFLLGEDIESPYGGAFKVTQGLSAKFPGRVRNTPISEAAITGLGTGLALSGMRPIVEIMFGDFSTLIFDQLLNHCAKFEQMYNGAVKVNLVVRTPMGGRRGYGPTHSQTLDKHFLGIPGLNVLALNAFLDPQILINILLNSDSGPTLLIENKLLYARELRTEAPEGFEMLTSKEEFPATWLRPLTQDGNCDVTIIGYGGMSEMLLEAALKLFEEHEIVAQVFCPSRLYPFSVASYLDVIKLGKSLVLVEEGQGFGNFSAELLAQLVELDPILAKRVKRVYAREFCIPASGVIEKQVLPDLEAIIQTVRSLK